MTCPEDASCPMPDRPGYCQEPKECQTNEDCSKGYVCKGAITCPDGAMCILPDQPGTCVWVLGGEGVWMAGNATEATNPADTPWRSMIQVALTSFGKKPELERDAT